MILETRAVAALLQERLRRRLRGDPRGGHHRSGRRGRRAARRRRRSHGLTIKHILLTHAHLDHVTGVGEGEGGARRARLAARGRQLPLRGGRPAGADVRAPRRAAAAGRPFYEGEGPLRFGRYGVRVLHTPGHCPGRRVPGGRAGKARTNATLFVGDTLFAGSIGRTDLPGGDLDDAAAIDPRRAVQLSRRHRRVVRATASRRRSAGRRRTNPFLI